MTRDEFERVESCIDAIRDGRTIILVDDEDRENEGDLVVAAHRCTPEHINFMCLHGRGLICLALTPERVAALRLPMMVQKDPGAMGTAFTVSIEARTGVTTGISAADRAETIRVASDPARGHEDIVSPGHIFPLRAHPAGVLGRSGHTEGSVDLARLAGLEPAGVICEIMRDDGEMARMDDLDLIARRHELPILSIADLIEYRMRREMLVEEVATGPLVSSVLGIEASDGWSMHSFRSKVNPETYYLALTKGDVGRSSEGPVLLRAQRAEVVGDVFGFGPDGSGSRLRRAIRQIDRAGRGVFLYVLGHALHDFDRVLRGQPTRQSAGLKPGEAGLREFGLGAQVLRQIGLSEIKVMTNNPRKIVAVEGFGIEVVGTVPLEEA
jgi:3,4-dihydroxy 2-butanone 4-phosphate synthase/GTP cyclohydrolase II